jgi:ribonuclease HI
MPKRLKRRPTHTVKIYTDGSAHGGYGGAAAILVASNGTTKEIVESFAPFYKKHPLSSKLSNITNQTMELVAVIIGLSTLKQPEPNAVYLRQVDVISDSAYVVNCFHEAWIHKWRQNGWKNYKGKPVVNRELWETLDALQACFDVTWKKVKGHDGHVMNERADKLAVAARHRAEELVAGRKY